MADKKLKTRIQLKHDTAANWGQATNFIPLVGEIIIYDADTTNSAPRVKIGDGVTVVAALPFISNADEIANAIAALDASDPSASGTSTTFISTVSQTDGVISATKATIPTAGSSLGMVKSGGDVTISNGVITVSDDSHNHVISNVDGLQAALNAKAVPDDITDAIAALDYTGATASGNSTSFITQITQTDGVVSATKATIPIATSSQAGLVKSGTDITVDSNGNVSVVNNSHSHTSANISDLNTTMTDAITSAISALDATDPAANGTATQFITSISQKDGVITATKANITAAALGLSGAMKFLGTSATAISDGATTNPITIGTTSTTVTAGNVVLYGAKEFVWTGSKWEELGNEGSYKVQQSAVSSPSASGNATAFIDSISQNAQGVITATKKNVTFPTLSGGSAAANNATVVGGVTVSGHAVTVGKKTLTAGSNVTITGGTDSITIAATDTDTHYTTGLTAGATGTTSNSATSNPYIKVKDNSTHRAQIQLKGSGATTVSSDANGVITITSTDNNTTYSAATTSAAGLMSAADKAKLDGIASGATANTGDITGVTAGNGLTGGGSSGSVTLNVGAGTGISVAADTVSAKLRSTTALTIDSAAATTTSGRVYPVVVDKSGYLSVNVPWVDTNTTYTLGSFGVTATAAELNKMDGVTATTAELNYVDGVTSNIQTQLNGKVPTSRTVNGKALSGDISLTYSDVGAAPATHSHDYLPLGGGTLTGTLTSRNIQLVNDSFAYCAADGRAMLQYNSSSGVRVGDYTKRMVILTQNDDIYHYRNGVGDSILLDTGNYSSYALPLSGGNLTGSLWLTVAGAERDIGIEYASGKALYLYGNSSTGTRGLHDTTNGTVISVANGANTFYGNATTATAANSATYASLLQPTDNTSTTTVSVSDWAGNTSSGKIVWRESFTESSLGTDNGAILFWLTKNTNAGGVGLNITIDGQLYQNIDKTVLDSGNYSSFAVPTSRTVNGKALSSNITLSASDINALPISGGTLTGSLAIGSTSSTSYCDFAVHRLSSSGVANTIWMAVNVAGTASIGHNQAGSTVSELTFGDGSATFENNLIVDNGSSNVYIAAQNNSYRIQLQSNTNGNKGIYDYTNNKWLIYSDSSNLTKVPSGQTVTEPCLRNIDCGTTALTAGSSSLTTGTIYIQYE